MILKSGKNRVIALMSSDMTQGSFGTDSTAVSESQTDLVSEVAATIQSLSNTTADKQLKTVHVLNSTTGNGSVYKEYGNLMNTGSTRFNRVVIADLSKTSAEEFQTNTVISII